MRVETDAVLADALKARRAELGHTQAQAEAEMGLPHNHVARWESGHQLPRAGEPEKMTALCDYLGLRRPAFAELMLRTWERGTR